MSGANGSNAVAARAADGNRNGAGYRVPTLDELRRVYEEGLEQTLLSGISVKMRPVRADHLLESGKVPDILTPLVMNMLFPSEKEVGPDVFPDEVGDYLAKPRDEKAEALEFIKSVNVVCEAALIDPSIVPYLSLPDRMWIFKLAFMPVEVLSRFRLQPRRNVESVDDEREQSHAAEHDDAGNRLAVQVEPADGVPV